MYSVHIHVHVATCSYSSEPAETTGEYRLAVTVPAVAVAVAGSHHTPAACTAEVAAALGHLYHTFPVTAPTATDRVGKERSRWIVHVYMYIRELLQTDSHTPYSCTASLHVHVHVH